MHNAESADLDDEVYCGEGVKVSLYATLSGENGIAESPEVRSETWSFGLLTKMLALYGNVETR